jgi:ubiquinone/menaquinone biosynthesis C-methylase UbiE
MIGHTMFWELAAPAYDLLTKIARWDRHTRLLAAELAAMEGEALSRILDVGTGPGTSACGLAQALPGARIVGLDVSSEMLRLARRRLSKQPALASHMDLLLADALALPLPDASFDAATGQSLLYLLPDRRRALREIARVLRPGGRMVLLEPRAGLRLGHLRRAWDVGHVITMTTWRAYSRLRGRFQPGELVALAEEAGFEVRAVRPVLDGLGLLLVADRP